jgi:hypothetical protein
MPRMHRILLAAVLMFVTAQGSLSAQSAGDTINRRLEELSRVLVESFSRLERHEFRSSGNRASPPRVRPCCSVWAARHRGRCAGNSCFGPALTAYHDETLLVRFDEGSGWEDGGEEIEEDVFYDSGGGGGW